MTERPAEVCENCGAPLEIEDGRCKYCGAVLAPAPDRRPLSGEEPALSDRVLGDGGLGLPLPAFPLLSGLWMISMGASAQAALDGGRLEGARQLVAAVRAAGERAADAGLGDSTLDPGAYRPEELWTFELARDLLAMLAGVDGVDRDCARLARNTVADCCDGTWERAFRHAAKQLPGPPPELADLRASVAPAVPTSGAVNDAPAGAPADRQPRRHFWSRG